MLFSKYRPTRWYTLVPLFIPSRRRTLYVCISWIWILLDNGTRPRMQLSGMSLEEESSIFIASCPIETLFVFNKPDATVIVYFVRMYNPTVDVQLQGIAKKCIE